MMITRLHTWLYPITAAHKARYIFYCAHNTKESQLPSTWSTIITLIIVTVIIDKKSWLFVRLRVEWKSHKLTGYPKKRGWCEKVVTRLAPFVNFFSHSLPTNYISCLWIWKVFNISRISAENIAVKERKATEKIRYIQILSHVCTHMYPHPSRWCIYSIPEVECRVKPKI